MSGPVEDGKFFVRIRPGYPNDYILAVVYKGKPTHHLIMYGEDQLYTVNRKAFGTHKTVEEVRCRVLQCGCCLNACGLLR